MRRYALIVSRIIVKHYSLHNSIRKALELDIYLSEFYTFLLFEKAMEWIPWLFLKLILKNYLVN